MTDDWLEVTVDQIAAPVPNALATGPFGSSISSRFFKDCGVPVIRGGNLSQDVGIRLIENDLAFLDPEKALEFRRSVARRGDLVFTCWGTIDQVGLIDSRCRYDEYVVSNKQMKLSPDPAKADSLFLYYLFSSTELKARVVAYGIGSSVPGFNLGQLRTLKLRLPSLDEQKRIAAILGAVDDKIELNRHMNQTLEAMARAVFRSWFVDFDPVVAEAEGRQPFGMDAETAALFPSRFVESELGPIPDGWAVSPIGEEVRVVGGSTPSTARAEYWESGTIHWVTPRDLARLSDPVVLTTERCITADGLEQISSGLLPVGTVLLSSRAPIGYLAVAEVPLAVNQGFIAMVCERRLPSLYVLRWAAETMEDILSRAGGTTFAEISKANFRPIPVLMPDSQVLKVYDAVVRPWFKLVVENVRQSRTVAELRDTLLPKLLSGEIRVRQAEKEVEAAL